MGFKFLRHISRTKGIAYLVDLSDDNYLTAYDTLYDELGKYSDELTQKPSLLIGTKIDEDGASERFEELKKKYSDKMTVLPLSIYDDELLEPVKKAFVDLSGIEKELDSTSSGFTSSMDKDAYYRDEE